MKITFDPDKKTIVCVGSALVDILANEDDNFLEEAGAAKGGMTLVDEHYIEELLSRASSPPVTVCGGSACNTAAGVGMLGGSARFVGKRGKDRLGDIFENELIRHSIEPYLFHSQNPTGRVLSVITPDAQRTMFTCLGAAAEMTPEDIGPECFEGAGIVHVEGYLLFNRDLMTAVLKAAKEAGAKVSLDLASFNVVEESKDLLNRIVAEYVDILIANEDEALAYTGIRDEEKALEAMAEEVEIAVFKLGPRGSMIKAYGETTKIEGMGDGNAMDTTGAGDLWAGGFLYGLIKGHPLSKSGLLGSACGYEVCQLIGAKIDDDGWVRIRNLLEE
ncbi:MAG: adenosine kinase [Desulfosalsimonas sp.]